MTKAHAKVGHKQPETRIHTAYSYGLDDREHVRDLEPDSPARLLDLVMEQRPNTERDVTISTCLLRPLEEVLESPVG